MRIFSTIRLVKPQKFSNRLPWQGCGEAGKVAGKGGNWPNLCGGRFGCTYQSYKRVHPVNQQCHSREIYPRDVMPMFAK